MVSFYDKLRPAQRQSRSVLIARLEGIFGALDDAELLRALKGKVHRGCQGYAVEALWRSCLAAYVLNIPTVAALIRFLQNHPDVSAACGLPPEVVPCEATYSRFIAKLARHNHLVEEVIRRGVAVLARELPSFGKTVAVDSTDVKAYSQSRRPSDPDARWGKKRDKHGRDYWWFGFKAHMTMDADHELPVHVEVTPANVSDSPQLVPALQKARVAPNYVLADAGYDSMENYRFIHDDLGAIPIIKLNKRGKRTEGRILHRTLEQIRLQQLREFGPIDRSSQAWEVLYAKRIGAERLFSRMKEFRRLGSVHHRGLAKVTLHCYLSTLTIVAGGLAAIYSGQSLRKVA